MSSNNLNFVHSTFDFGKRVNPRLGFVFIALIILQFYFFEFIASTLKVDYTIYIYLSNALSHAIIVLSILIFNHDKLKLFRDHFTLWAIALSCFLPTVAGESMVVYKSFMFFLGIMLSAYILINRKNISFLSLKTIIAGILWAICTVAMLALIYALLDQKYALSFPSDLMAIIVSTLFFQLSYVSIVEEACFRGLLFNFMVMNGYKENTALFIQALLFWGIHFRYINNPLKFFVAIPLFTIAVTLMAIKYKTIFLSIIMHTLTNVFMMLLVSFINHYLF